MVAVVCIFSAATRISALAYDGPGQPSIQKPVCSDSPYSITISWSDTVPEGERRYYISIYDTPIDEFRYWSKQEVVEGFFASAPENFDATHNPGTLLVLNPGTVYQVRVTRVPFSDNIPVNFSVPFCTPTPTPIPSQNLLSATPPVDYSDYEKNNQADSGQAIKYSQAWFKKPIIWILVVAIVVVVGIIYIFKKRGSSKRIPNVSTPPPSDIPPSNSFQPPVSG